METITANEILAGMVREGAATPVPAVTRDKITKIRYSHDAMVDMLVENPWISQGELARHFGYSESWISIVLNTNMFQAKLAERREELVDPVIRATLEERFRAMVTRSLEVLQEKLSRPVDKIPDNLALRAMELGAKALGVGGNAPAPSIAVPVDHLTLLAERLVALKSVARRLENETVETVEIKSSVEEG